MKQFKKLFVVRKYILAISAAQAIKLESKTPPDDVWIDEEWKKNNSPVPSPRPVGFQGKKVV